MAEEHNIDDLVDYNDFESHDLGSNSEQDSFNCDIMRIYEDHKKNVNGNFKTNEVLNNQRPVSSYQRNLLTENRKDTSQEVLLTEGNKFEINESSLKELLTRFNKFLQKSEIKETDFCDNLQLFIDINDFKDLFRKIRFDISPLELKMLFYNRNPNSSEGVIQIKMFLDNYSFQWKTVYLENINTNYDIKKLNSDFKNLHNEIMEIVKNDIFDSQNKFYSKTRNTSAKKRKIHPITNNNSNNTSNIKSEKLPRAQTGKIRPLKIVIKENKIDPQLNEKKEESKKYIYFFSINHLVRRK
jgi:hypothetical protein